MFKTILALLILTHTYALLAADALASKTEVELKIALTKIGYNSLKAAMKDNYDYETSERTDYYFDYYEHSSYVLRDLEQPVKLRVMVGEDSVKWQNQTVIKTAARSIFSIKTTTASEIELKHDKVFFESIELYMKKLAAHDKYALNLAADIQKSMLEKGLLKNDGHNYFPTHFNHKKRTKIKLKLGSEQFSVQVGETNNRGEISYEMEAEIKKGDDINKSADVLNKWLQSQGFNATHIDISVPTDPTIFSESILDELFVL